MRLLLILLLLIWTWNLASEVDQLRDDLDTTVAVVAYLVGEMPTTQKPGDATQQPGDRVF